MGDVTSVARGELLAAHRSHGRFLKNYFARRPTPFIRLASEASRSMIFGSVLAAGFCLRRVQQRCDR